MYFAEPESSTGGRGLECARGRIIGGSSSINAMAYVRGHPGDYDRWASYGLTGWSYADVLPYFRRQESWKGGASFYRGSDGPLVTQMTRFSDPLVEAFGAAGRAAGYRSTPDYNGAQQEGFGVWQMTVKDGRRCSAADAYLRPACNGRTYTSRSMRSRPSSSSTASARWGSNISTTAKPSGPMPNARWSCAAASSTHRNC